MKDRETMEADPQQHQDTAGPEIIAAHSELAVACRRLPVILPGQCYGVQQATM